MVTRDKQQYVGFFEDIYYNRAMKTQEFVLGSLALLHVAGFAVACTGERSGNRRDPSALPPMAPTRDQLVDCASPYTDWHLCAEIAPALEYPRMLHDLYDSPVTPVALRAQLQEPLVVLNANAGRVTNYLWFGDIGRGLIQPGCKNGLVTAEIIAPRMFPDRDPLPAIALAIYAHELRHAANEITWGNRQKLCPVLPPYDDEDQATYDDFIVHALAVRFGYPGFSREREIRENGAAFSTITLDILVSAGISWNSSLFRFLVDELVYRHIQRMNHPWESLSPAEQGVARVRDARWQDFLTYEAKQEDLKAISAMTQRGLVHPKFFSPYAPDMP